MTESSIKHVVTLGNSIIGVSVLAMPFCFQQCGVILGIVMLLASAFLTRFNCHLLLKAALISRRKTFELLAFHAFGFHGKLAVETSIICFLLGILVSFYVVIGDITPAIIGQMLNIEINSSLRTLILTAVGLGVALPLGLLKNINSLGNISVLSFCFYIFLIFKIFSDALPILLSERWWDNITFWQPQGILRCLPIFALAVSCQTQIFEIYDSLPDPSLGKMNRIIKLAVNLCVFVYISVGLLGYIAFVNKEFSGNVLVNMPSTFLTEFIKLGFVLSVALSFPLVIFPCRTSLCSLLSKKTYSGLDMGSNYIPEVRFRTITISVVVITLILGILCPNIELVLGLVGSTIGTVICIIFPAILFIRVTNKNTFERFGAQVVFCGGVFLLIACTHVTIHKPDQEPMPFVVDTIVPDLNLARKDVPLVLNKEQAGLNEPEKPLKLSDIYELPKIEKPVTVKFEKATKVIKSDDQRRLEPPIPQEPDSNFNNKNDPKDDTIKKKIDHPEQNVPNLNVKVDQQSENKNKETTEKENSKRESTKTKDVASQQEELLKKLEHQQIEQAKLIEEQKHLLEELKAHKETHLVNKETSDQANPVVSGPKETEAKQKLVETRPTKKPEKIAAIETLPKKVETKDTKEKFDVVEKELTQDVQLDTKNQQNHNKTVENEKPNAVENVETNRQPIKAANEKLQPDTIIVQDANKLILDQKRVPGEAIKILKRDTNAVENERDVPLDNHRSKLDNQNVLDVLDKSHAVHDMANVTIGAIKDSKSLSIGSDDQKNLVQLNDVVNDKAKLTDALVSAKILQQKQDLGTLSPNLWRKDEQKR